MAETVLTETEARAQALQVSEKGCRCCKRRFDLSDGGVICRVGKRFPACRGKKNGFQLDTGE